jgi:ABC transporter substrate binding protein (PQQ-dependent alcohol dehydrogenase system)
MNKTLFALLAILAWPMVAFAQSEAPQRDIKIIYVDRAEDPFYDPPAQTDGVIRVPNMPPLAGAELGLKDVAILGRAANVRFVLDHRTIAADGDAQADIARFAAEAPAVILLDLPHDDMIAAAKAVPAGSVALVNIRDTGDDLRRSLCNTALFHTIPSQTAYSDALAQFIIRKNWKRVLTLIGPEPEDQDLAKIFAGSVKKFGAKIVDTKPFIAGNDPRKREENSTALMTGDSDYDVIFVADTTGDFGRFVEFRQVKPRPVIGSEGLQASAWHRAAERYGAPQVNHRFERDHNRPMSDMDWSAWVAVKVVAEAVAREKVMTGAEISAALLSGKIDVEMTKGMPGSFRTWDHQLRQPIMLHTADAVVAIAPIDGFLHENSILDTLGLSDRDTQCKSK